MSNKFDIVSIWSDEIKVSEMGPQTERFWFASSACNYIRKINITSGNVSVIREKCSFWKGRWVVTWVGKNYAGQSEASGE